MLVEEEIFNPGVFGEQKRIENAKPKVKEWNLIFKRHQVFSNLKKFESSYLQESLSPKSYGINISTTTTITTINTTTTTTNNNSY